MITKEEIAAMAVKELRDGTEFVLECGLHDTAEQEGRQQLAEVNKQMAAAGLPEPKAEFVAAAAGRGAHFIVSPAE